MIDLIALKKLVPPVLTITADEVVEEGVREALESFRVGTVQDASIPELWYNIGVLYENNNQITPAYFAYSQAI